MHGDMKRPLPTVAPVATQQAKIAHKNIMTLIKGGTKLEKFVYKDLGAMATIGRGEAVVGSPKMTGFMAWCAWMVVHLIRLAGFYTNMTVAFKWALNFLTSARLGRVITNISLDPEK